MKVAILQVADTGPLESLVVMLAAVGYRCYLPGRALKDQLRQIGCDTVLDVEGLVANWGYEKPAVPSLESTPATPDMMETCDLFVDIKMQRNGTKIWARWPRLKGKSLWYRINGGRPEHVINHRGDMGDEVNVACPILTPDLWYKDVLRCFKCHWSGRSVTGVIQPGETSHVLRCPDCKEARTLVTAPWWGLAYACWPPFYRWNEYKAGRVSSGYSDPVCLIHNVMGWGYGTAVDRVRQLGVKMLGGGGSPDGLIHHRAVPDLLHKTLAMVHLKSNDAPGYALYEALASACPVIVAMRLIRQCRMESLFTPGETCLTFEDENVAEPDDQVDPSTCVRDIKAALEKLRDPRENRRIGDAGRERLRQLMWDSARDSSSLREFMERHFS